MKVSNVAKLTGVTVRTLHYYDEILQQILFFRELDFSLEEIREIMQNPTYEKETALQNQKALLVQKRNRLDQLIALVDKSLMAKVQLWRRQ